MKETGLVKYDAMVTAIAECHSADEAKEIRDKARALEVYAQQAMNTEAEHKAAEVRIRAERKTGQLLRAMKSKGKQGGDRKSSNTVLLDPTLDELGISKMQSSRWQALAEVDEQQFEAALKDPDKKPTTAGIIEKQTVINDDGLWILGRLREFERRQILTRSPRELFENMTDGMLSEARRLAPIVADWLTQIRED